MMDVKREPIVAVVGSEGYYEGVKRALEVIEKQVAESLKS